MRRWLTLCLTLILLSWLVGCGGVTSSSSTSSVTSVSSSSSSSVISVFDDGSVNLKLKIGNSTELKLKMDNDLKNNLKLKMDSELKLKSFYLKNIKGFNIKDTLIDSKLYIIAIDNSGMKYKAEIDYETTNFIFYFPIGKNYTLFFEYVSNNRSVYSIINYSDGQNIMSLDNNTNKVIDLGNMKFSTNMSKLITEKTPDSYMDKDNDGIKDDIDGDDDNDGISDIEDLDKNNDGVIDLVGVVDMDNDGVPDIIKNIKEGNTNVVKIFSADITNKENITNSYIKAIIAADVNTEFYKKDTKLYKEAVIEFVLNTNDIIKSLRIEKYANEYTNKVVEIIINPVYTNYVSSNLLSEYTNFVNNVTNDTNWNNIISNTINNNSSSSSSSSMYSSISSVSSASSVSSVSSVSSESSVSSVSSVSSSANLVNLAIGKTAKALTNESFTNWFEYYAVDGNTITRWAGPKVFPQWIYVDLLANYSIKKIILRWEACAAGEFYIEISSDLTNWTNIYTGTGQGNNTVDIISNISAYGRYVRMTATNTYGTAGTSLYEFEIYGEENQYSNIIQPNILWELNGNAYDSFGNYNGTTSWSISYVNGVNGNPNSAIKFDFESYVSIPYTANLNLTPGFTICFWISNANGNSIPIIKEDQYFFYIWDSGGNNGLIHFGVLTNSPTNEVNSGVGSGYNVLDGNWHHIAGVIESNYIKLYVDGILRSSNAFNYNTAWITNLEMRFGTRVSSIHLYYGVLDQVRVYHRALSQVEISNIYANKE